jgi:hypothetical protein
VVCDCDEQSGGMLGYDYDALMVWDGRSVVSGDYTYLYIGSGSLRNNNMDLVPFAGQLGLLLSMCYGSG